MARNTSVVVNKKRPRCGSANFHLADSDMNLVHMADQVEVICRQLLVTRML
ncbi:hypothetical protein D1AOALGA4SA_9270, partial [Olavius algarvensis Delta 1 endosymbiont]